MGAGIGESGFIAFSMLLICGDMLSAFSAATGLSTNLPDVSTSVTWSGERVEFIPSFKAFNLSSGSALPVFGVSGASPRFNSAESTLANGFYAYEPKFPTRKESIGS